MTSQAKCKAPHAVHATSKEPILCASTSLTRLARHRVSLCCVPLRAICILCKFSTRSFKTFGSSKDQRTFSRAYCKRSFRSSGSSCILCAACLIASKRCLCSMSSADASSLTLCCFFRSLALTLRAKLSTPRTIRASTNAFKFRACLPKQDFPL